MQASPSCVGARPHPQVHARRRLPRFTLILLAMVLVPATACAARRADVSRFEVGADSNSTWPAGWMRGGNQPSADVRLVTPGHGEGRAVLLSTPLQKGYVALLRTLPDSMRAGAVAVRLTAWIRTEGAGRASMWVHLHTAMSTIPPDETPDRWPQGATGWTRYQILVPVLPEVQRVTFGIKLAGGGSMWADDLVLEALGPDQVPPSSQVAQGFLEAALDSLCRRTVLTSQLSWGVLQRAARTQMLGAKVTADAYDALRYAVRRIDPEGGLIPPSRPEPAGPLDKFAPRIFVEAEGMIGVIRMPVCNRGSRVRMVEAADTTRSGIARANADHVRGWLVDLRDVSSGEVAPAIAGLGPLLGEGRLFGWLRPDGRRGYWTHHHGLVEYSPGAPPECRLASGVAPNLEVPNLPVAVLIGPKTASAGEAIAAAFRGRANTRFFGEPTAGRGNVRERVRLSDGAVLHFATGQLTDRTGRLIEGAIQPDDSLTAVPAASGEDTLTALALQWLRRAGVESR